MNDILPPSVPRRSSARWEWLETAVRKLMARYGYRNLRTPDRRTYGAVRARLGEVTDIVEKEMYSFHDRSDKYGDNDHLTLRPENTAGIVRAAIEHNMLYDGGKRLWAIGPMFRHERPQRGRFRQFHQIDVEALGFAGPDVDAELILLASGLWKAIEGPDRCAPGDQQPGPAGRACPAPRGQLIALLRAACRQARRGRSAACTAIRCASSTPRIRRCRRWWSRRRS
jgi:histidyl-tRNA synthetase